MIAAPPRIDPAPRAHAGRLFAADSLAGSAIWLMAGKTVAFVIAFALPLLLVRRLSQTEFGLYKQVFLLVGTGITVLPLGFVMSAFYFLPRQPGRQSRVAFNVLLFHAAVAGVAAVALLWWPAILQAIFHDPSLVAMARPIAGCLFLMIAFSFLELLALANGDVRAATLLIVVSNLTKTLLLLGAAFVFGSVEALIYAAALQGLLQAGLVLWYLHARFPRVWRGGDWTLLRAQAMYALPLGTAAILSMVQGDLHFYFVAHYFDAATYAIYAIGCFQLPLVSILSESVGSVMIPAIGRLQLEAKSREIIQLTARLMRVLAAIYFPLYVFLLVTGREFITLLFTTRYLDSWPIFLLNLTPIPLGILGSASDPVLRAYPQYTAQLLRLRLVLLGVVVVVLWAVTSHGLLLGAIAAVVGVHIADRVVLCVVLGRALQVSWRDLALLRDVGKLAVAAVAAGLLAGLARAIVAGWAPLLVLALSGVVFGAAYLLCVWALGVMTSEEHLALRQHGRRLLARCGIGARPATIESGAR
jgi:O-antigen/teichoic acid export membrane protein